MVKRRLAALIGVAAVVAAACGGGATASPSAGGGSAAGCTVGVSWNNYQEERWAKWDEPALKKAIEDAGGKYISNDAASSSEKQASN
ncbi:MAG: D-xylose ABC transporter substrate-binding protein, partial [Chloroflexota bacterium]